MGRDESTRLQTSSDTGRRGRANQHRVDASVVSGRGRGRDDAAVVMLVLLFTFARSESPLALAFSGENAFNGDKQMQVKGCGLGAAKGHQAGSTHATPRGGWQRGLDCDW